VIILNPVNSFSKELVALHKLFGTALRASEAKIQAQSTAPAVAR
jgi:hypothetical protein